MNNFYGLVKKCVPKYKMLLLEKEDKTLSYFSLTKGQFKSYLSSISKEKNVYVLLSYDENNYKQYSNYISYKVNSLEKVQAILTNKIVDLYINVSSKDYIKHVLSKEEYKMFLDFEFTMPQMGNPIKTFKVELVQAGFVLLDSNDKVVYEYSNYIKTNIPLTQRCMRFLDLDEEVLSDSISQKEFYNDFKEIIDIYNPSIYTWGGSDEQELKDFYSINKLRPIKTTTYDLSDMIKRYYELPENIGLFRALKIFKDINVLQAHHALTDAAVTKEIYDSFKKELYNPEIDVLDRLLEIKALDRAIKEEKKQQRLLKKEVSTDVE